MPKKCPPGAPSTAMVLRALDELWEVTLEDIESGWIDIMVKRLLQELDRQLRQVEKTKTDTELGLPTPQERAQNAAVLAKLEHTMERLVKLEKDRDVLKSRKGKKSRGETRSEIHAKAIRVVDAADAGGLSRKSDR